MVALEELGEPLLAVGARYRSSMVPRREVPGGDRFNHDNYDMANVESAVVPPSPPGYLVEIQRLNFRPGQFRVEHTGDVVIRADGREVLRTRQVAFEFPWGAEAIGRNPFGTTCAAEFRCWLLDVRFVPRP
jgi:hypothetical protein